MALATWFIEAIQPEDGMVFVSERQTPNGEPTRIYYAAAPKFHPVPVRNLATALWATRGTFQDRVFRPPPSASLGEPPDDPSGGSRASYRRVEVRFDTLPQTLEFARRLYLASGPSSTPSGSGGPIVPPTDPGLGPHLFLEAIKTKVDTLENSTRQELASDLDTLSNKGEHVEALRRCALLALAHMPSGTEATFEPEERRIAIAVLLDKSGLWDGFQHLRSDWLNVTRTRPEAVTFPRWQGSRVSGSGETMQRWMLGGLLFHVPAPVTFPPYRRGLPTLGHHLCTALADRAFWQSVTASHDLVPLQLAALLLAAGTVNLVPGSKALAAPVMRKANRWLGNHAPDRALAKVPGAEAAISNLILARASAQEQVFVKVEREERERAAAARQRQSAESQKEVAQAHELEARPQETLVRGELDEPSRSTSDDTLSEPRQHSHRLEYPSK